jgi:kumamolisin
MTANDKRTVVPGSERHAVPGAQLVGAVPMDERFGVTVRVRRKTALQNSAAEGVHADTLPGQRHYLTREQYAADNGSDPADLAKVAAFAQAHGLVVVDTSVPRRSVFLSGTTAQYEAAFGTTIQQYEHEDGIFRGRTGSLSVPAELVDLVEGIFGIDDRAIAQPHFQLRQPAAGIQPIVAGGAFTPLDLAKLYNFPTAADGTGQCIAIIELGGGYRTADITAYFQNLGLPTPNVTAVRVDNAKNAPTTSNSADGEVMLDIEVAAAIAPKAHIAVYFAPNTDKGFLDAITMAIHDTVNKPSVISISWGSAEKNWTTQAMTSFDQAFQTAAALGVTVCVAAGDNGSGDSVGDGMAHVDFPASSPFALGCGGTKLVAAGTTITSETVWNENPTSSATGGGVSDFFAVPTYQSTTGIPASANPPGTQKGRGVPDVAGDADPATGYRVRVDGLEFVIGGTSAVAPLWAGIIALTNQKLGHHVGFLNPLLYGTVVGTGSFQDITSGNNGDYSAKVGWDPCTGWGTPNGGKLLKALGG